MRTALKKENFVPETLLLVDGPREFDSESG